VEARADDRGLRLRATVEGRDGEVEGRGGVPLVVAVVVAVAAAVAAVMRSDEKGEADSWVEESSVVSWEERENEKVWAGEMTPKGAANVDSSANRRIELPLTMSGSGRHESI